MSKFWPQHRGAELGCQRMFQESVTWYTRKRSKQYNVWCRTLSIWTVLSTGRRTSATWRRRRRKKRFTRSCTYREYTLVCLWEMCYYDERRRVLLLPGAGRSEWKVRFFRFVFKLFFVQKLNYLELNGKLTFPVFVFLTGINCITEHPKFNIVCLDTDVLSTALVAIHNARNNPVPNLIENR